MRVRAGVKLRNVLMAAAVCGLTGVCTALAQGPATQPTAAPAAAAPTTMPAVAAPATKPAAPAVAGPAVPEVVVIGSSDDVFRQPGSADYIDTERLREQNYDDINRVLQTTPGVYVRQEDGYGLFPNISLRGADVARSAKVTLMEDGVLTAPAPYSGPEAYYSPTVARMHAVEVLKGSSQIRYGPHTTGGVINYVSTPIPETASVYLKTVYGSFNDIRVHGYAGNTFNTDIGRVGVLVEGFLQSTDGYKEIDTTPDFNNGDDTGFFKGEPMLKLSWEPNTEVYQRLEFKLGHTRLDADQGYLGLTQDDFDDDPYRLYSGGRFDNIKSNQTRTYLRHFIKPSDSLDITTTAYYSKFNRNWYKLNDLRAIPGVGNLSLSQALAGAGGGAGLALLKGQGEGTLRYRNNDREYELYGIESFANIRFDTGDLKHTLTVGGRAHYDYSARDQFDELFVQAANGTITSSSVTAPGSAGDREESSKAYSVYVQDTIAVGQFTFTPGIRFEHVDQEFEDFLADTSGSDSMNLLAGGVGATYDLNDNWTFFGGVYRGYSVPDPLGRITEDLKEESSIATDVGVRYRSPNRALRTELVGFYTYFDNLLVIDNIGGSGSGVSENVGEVNSFGAEFSAEYDLGVAKLWNFNNPWFLKFTYTNAELASDSTSTDAESMFAGGEEGNKVPYIPEFVISAGVGVDFEKFGMHLVGSYVDETFTTASNTSDPVDVNGNPDARYGKTDSYFLLDFSAYYRLNENTKLLGGVQNILDEEYVSSRHPHGARPGKPRFFYVGLEMTW